MKKSILVALMVLIVATPCLAQEVEPEGLFSIEGTRWSYCSISFGIYCALYVCMPGVLRLANGLSLVECGERGFYRGEVYGCRVAGSICGNDVRSNDYIDLPLVSIVYFKNSRQPCFELYTLQPSGLGVYTKFGAWHLRKGYESFFGYSIGTMFKIDDNWAPSDAE